MHNNVCNSSISRPQTEQIRLAFSLRGRAYFSVYYYTKCALLKAGCETLKIHVCNIKICTVPFRAFSISLVKEKRIEEVYMTKKRSLGFWAKKVITFLAAVEQKMMMTKKKIF